MRSFSTLALAMGATAASAQLLPSMFAGLSFSPQCQVAIISVFTNGSFAECIHVDDIIPFVTSGANIIPTLDKFMTDLCYDSPCSNDALEMAYQTILSGCSGDLQMDGLSNSSVSLTEIYPVFREVLCLKTTDPYTNTSYGGFLGNPPIPIDGNTYNSTNGTFCVTSVLTQLSAYFDANFTLPYIEAVLAGNDSEAVSKAEMINPNVLCNECIFGALDVLEAAVPALGSIDVSSALAYLNMSVPQGTTVNEVFNQTCAYKPLYVTPGELPTDINVSIVNSSFPLTPMSSGMSPMMANGTMPAGAGAPMPGMVNATVGM